MMVVFAPNEDSHQGGHPSLDLLRLVPMFCNRVIQVTVKNTTEALS